MRAVGPQAKSWPRHGNATDTRTLLSANSCNPSLRGQTLAVHGWIYGLQDGLLRDLDTTVTQPDEVATSYREALSKLS